jgi:hypothetical protein
MRLIILFILLVLSASVVNAQNIDLGKIRNEVSDKESRFYYPKLIEQFKTNPSFLDSLERVHLYFGQSESKLSTSNHERLDILHLIFNGDSTTGPSIEKGHLIIMCDSILMENPFNLFVLNHQLLLLNLEDKQRSLRVSQLNIIMDAIKSSGDGLSLDTRFFVTDDYHAKVVAVSMEYYFDEIEKKNNNIIVLSDSKNIEIRLLYFEKIKRHTTPNKNH